MKLTVKSGRSATEQGETSKNQHHTVNIKNALKTRFLGSKKGKINFFDNSETNVSPQYMKQIDKNIVACTSEGSKKYVEEMFTRRKSAINCAKKAPKTHFLIF